MISVDIFQYHVYRLESAANSKIASLYVDGVLAHSWTARDSVLGGAPVNGWNFGHGASGGANADWSYFHVSQPSGGQGQAVPEPSAVLLLASGLAGLTIRARRTSR